MLRPIDLRGGDENPMSKGPRYHVPLKRRRESRTDYRKRKVMILSRIPRLAVRRSLNNVLGQIIDAYPEGDKTLAAANSRELAGYGWKASCGNVPAAYLTGLLIGFKAQSTGIKQVIPDIGLRRPCPGSRVFALIKGAMDSGLTIPCGDVLPEETRIKGEHIASYARKLVEAEPEVYERRFSSYLSRSLKPEDLPAHFEEVKSNVLRALGKEG